MDSIRLKNFKCLEDTGKISLKPLTFLVGANSSGKSSFARFFPLLRQSLFQARRGMFLWYNSTGVDFRDFSNTLRHDSNIMEIDIDLNRVHLFKRKKIDSKSIVTNFSIHIELIPDDNFIEKVSFIQIEHLGNIIKFIIDKNEKNVEIQINSFSSKEINGEKLSITRTNSLLPSIIFRRGNISGFEYSNVITQKILGTFENAGIAPDVKNLIKLTELTFNGEFFDNVSEDFQVQLRDLAYMFSINDILDSINIYFINLRNNINYIGPLRKSAERYYRFENTSVNEIDPDGGNLAMFLNSLDKEQISSLNEWLRETFSFSISLRSSEGHVEIMIHQDDAEKRNIFDVGFGYTQLLPIVVDIWKTLYIDSQIDIEVPKILKTNHYVVIEQPELHLHPRFQTLFAQMLAKVIVKSEEKNIQLKLIIETHSEVILNEIGSIIGDGELNPKDVSVILFNARQEGMNHDIEIAEFDSDGYLTNWPIGFFA